MGDQRQGSKMNHADLFVTPALFYIETLIKALSKKNHKAVAQELSAICAQQGPTANRHLLQALFATLDFSADPQVVIKTKDFHQAIPVQLLVQQVSSSFDLPLFKTLLYYCFEKPFDLLQEAQYLSNPQLIPLCGRFFKFNREQENRLCILLLKSNLPQIRNQAAALIKQKFGDILKSYCDADERLLQDTTDKTVFHELLTLLEPGSREEFAERVTVEQEEEFRHTLKRLYPHSRHIPLQIKPLLLNHTYADADHFEIGRQLEMSRNFSKVNLDSDHDLLVRLLIEFGFKALETAESCRSCLGGILSEYITPESVARCIGLLASIIPVEELGPEEVETIEMDQQVRNTGYYVMWSRSDMKTIRTEAKERDRRRMDNFVSAVVEKCPTLSWREVVYEMDYEGFHIFDRAGLQLILIGLMRGLQNTQFPIELLYRHWTNSDAQLAWFTHALKNPDVFCFSDFQSDRADLTILKSHPDEYRSREIQSWYCIDLIETLLYLADSGFSQEVLALMEFPLLRCPDALLLTLLQLGPSSTITSSKTRQQLVRLCIQKFLVTHPNSQAVLHFAWTMYPNNKMWAQQTMVEAMADWYVSGKYDQARLARIIDVAQDLKALADLLQCDILPFVIDLACLAARREFLKLDKWMTDRMSEHGVKFVAACLKFLERRCPTLVTGDPLKDEREVARNAQLPADTIGTFLRHLQDALTHYSLGFDTISQIMKLIKHSPAVHQRPNPPPSVLKPQPESPSELRSPPADPLRLLTASEPAPSANPGPIGPPLTRPSPFPMPNQPFSPPPQIPSDGDGRGFRPSLESPFKMVHPIGPNVSTANTPTTASTDLYHMLPEVRKSYPQDVEQEVYKYFQSMFTNTLPMSAVIERMRTWKESKSDRERNLFDCIIRNVYEEHQWLHQYPEKEFEITARFFGTLIHNGFLSFMGLGIALRQLLEYLRLGPPNILFRFAVLAMDMFKERLQEYAQFCIQVVHTPSFKELSPELREYVMAGTRSEQPATSPPAATAKPAILPASTAGAGSRPNETALSPSPRVPERAPGESDESDSEEPAPLTAPPETIRDKMSFLFNNISMSNVKDKISEFKELFKGEDSEKYMRWIADYIVMKRAGQENNFHPLYFVFMQHIDMPLLYKMTVKETVKNIRSMLRSEKGLEKVNDRALLKNLGAWLGFLTIAMNRPIRSKDLDMKALIVEAYRKGPNELNYSLPLVTKILALSAKSKLFGKNNPWIKTVLAMLGSIHSESTTKLNLKFEVEVLAKTLDLEVAELGESNLLKNEEYVRWVMEFGQQLFGPHLRKGKQPSGPTPVADQPQQAQGPAAPVPAPAPPPAPIMMPQPSGFHFHYNDLHPPQFQSTFTRISFSPDIPILKGEMSTTIRNAFRIGVERTLQEYLMPCVDRCMRIVVPAATVIAKKDFYFDGDGEKLRQAGTFMVRHLASGLSFATMREHLQGSLVDNTRKYIAQQLRSVTEEQQKVILISCEHFARENLELCSAFLQKAAAERCVMEIDKAMTEEIKRRMDSKAEGKSWFDEEEAKFQREKIPSALRLDTSQDRPAPQMAVYEHFMRNVPGFMSEMEIQMIQAQERMFKMKWEQQARRQQLMQAGAPKIMGQDVKEEDFIMLCESMVQKLTGQVSIMSNLIPNAANNHHLQLTTSLKNKIQDVRNVVRSGAGGIRAIAPEIIQYIVEILLEGLSPEVMQSTLNQQAQEMHSVPTQDIIARFKEACVSVLVAFQDPKIFGSRFVMQAVMMVFAAGDRENPPVYPHFKLESFETFNVLIRCKIVAASFVDHMLTKAIDNTASRQAVDLATQMIKAFCVEEKMFNLCGESDLFFTIEAVFRFCTRHNDVPFQVHYLMDEVKVDLSPYRRFDNRRDSVLENPVLASYLHQSIVQVREYVEIPVPLREKAENILREWYTMVTGPQFGPAMHAIEKSSEPLPRAMEQVRLAFQRVFQDGGIQLVLRSEENAVRFFKFCIDICARDCYRMVAEQPVSNMGVVQDQMRLKMAPMLDALARLFVLIVRFTGDASSGIKLPWLLDPAMAVSKILGIIAGIMLVHQDQHDVNFLAYPFHRIIYSFFMDLFINEFKFAQIQEQIMLGFCNFFHSVRPQRLPGFTASWLELIFHRDIIRRINELPEKKGWEMFVQLLIDSIKFVAPFVRNLMLNRALSIVFRALLRFLYTLHHDYPEVLAEYYCVLVDVIPTNCLNMRNVVLSAAPIHMATDDPYAATFKIEDQKGIDFLPPRIVTRCHMFLQPISFRNDLDSYLNSRAPVTFLADLLERLEMSRLRGQRYHVQMLNALVLYLGQQAVASLTAKGVAINSTTVAHSSHTDIIQNLAINFDNEGRYLLVNALVNHLRYPNIHTHYYYCVILHLFRDMSNHQHLQELIVRVLLERITSHRPHPWGLVATCSQVIRGPEYGFFEKDFVNFNDDLFRLPIFRVIEGLPANKMKHFYTDEQQQQQRLTGSFASDAVNNADAVLDAEIRSAANFSGHRMADGPSNGDGKTDADLYSD